MKENAENKLSNICEILMSLPEDEKKKVEDLYSNHMEGFVQGFAAGKAYAEKK